MLSIDPDDDDDEEVKPVVAAVPTAATNPENGAGDASGEAGTDTVAQNNHDQKDVINLTDDGAGDAPAAEVNIKSPNCFRLFDEIYALLKRCQGS